MYIYIYITRVYYRNIEFARWSVNLPHTQHTNTGTAALRFYFSTSLPNSVSYNEIWSRIWHFVFGKTDILKLFGDMERELWVIDICRYISICMYIFYTNCTILLYYYTVCMVWASKLNVVCFFAYAILVATLHNSVFECVCDRMYVYMYIHVRYVVVIVLVHIVYAYALYEWSE